MRNENLSSRVRNLHVRARKLVDSFFAGSYHSVFKGIGIEFDEVREYEYGDDTRFIDWNVSSRMITPYTKTFKEERELILFIIVDVSASLKLGNGPVDKREIAGTLFALLSLAAQANHDKVGSLLFSDSVERLIMPNSGRRHILRQISDVLGYQALGRGSNLAAALRTAAQTLKRKSIIAILSDFRTSHYQRELSLLSRKHEVIAIRLSDPLDREYPQLGLAELEDPETGESLVTWGFSSSLKRDYENYWNDHRQMWLCDCRSAGTDILEVSTDEDPADSLQAFFRRRRGV